MKYNSAKQAKVDATSIPKARGNLRLKAKGDTSKKKNQTVEAIIIIIVCGIAISIISMIIAIILIGVIVFGVWGGIG